LLRAAVVVEKPVEWELEAVAPPRTPRPVATGQPATLIWPIKAVEPTEVVTVVRQESIAAWRRPQGQRGVAVVPAVRALPGSAEVVVLVMAEVGAELMQVGALEGLLWIQVL